MAVVRVDVYTVSPDIQLISSQHLSHPAAVKSSRVGPVNIKFYVTDFDDFSPHRVSVPIFVSMNGNSQ